MIKTITGLLLTLSMSLAVQNTMAADDEGNYAIWGEGGAS